MKYSKTKFYGNSLTHLYKIVNKVHYMWRDTKWVKCILQYAGDLANSPLTLKEAKKHSPKAFK